MGRFVAIATVGASITVAVVAMPRIFSSRSIGNVVAKQSLGIVQVAGTSP